MVLHRHIISVIATIPLLAAASELTERQAQCNTGSILCCNQTESASSSIGQALLGLFGIPIGSVSGLIGISCSPISVIGIGGNSCSAQPVCCTNNSFNGVIALGCFPINLNL
ncbi:hydrophobin-251 [Agrocybe pediades]|nr:hydrophobin-251 [Agrocybe pediades]